MEKGVMEVGVREKGVSEVGAKSKAGWAIFAALLVFLAAAPASAQEVAGGVDSGDTAWLLLSSALVMLMTPALGFFYGGMVGQKNVLATIGQSFFLLCLISVQWVLWGYTLAFGPDAGGLIGKLDYLGFRGVGQDPGPAATVPHLAFAVFQGMFAVITPALITGAFAERMKFSAFLLFSLLWATLVYDPLAHWVWGGGFLQKLGALDFAGGTVVHISSGVSALVAALVVGRRRGFPERVSPPHSLPLTVLGAALLWFGWFGFNAGSAVAAGGLASSAFVVTNAAAAMAALGWAFLEWLLRRKPTVLGISTGAVAGLVAITPASGYVAPLPALVIGAVAGMVCYLAVSVLKPRLGYDDSLDVFGVHGVGGTWGAMATGLFASRAVNSAGADGLFYGNPGLLLPQLAGVAAAWTLALVGTFVVLKVVSALTGLRVTPEEESLGLDLSQHGEAGYNFGPPVFAGGSPLGSSAAAGSEDAVLRFSPAEGEVSRPGTLPGGWPQ